MDKIVIKISSLEFIKERSSYNHNFYKFLPNTNHIILEEYSEANDIGLYWHYSKNFECVSFLGCARYSDWENGEELIIDLFRT